MRCFICKKFLRGISKYELCSRCQGSGIGTMIREGLIDKEKLKFAINTSSTGGKN